VAGFGNDGVKGEGGAVGVDGWVDVGVRMGVRTGDFGGSGGGGDIKLDRVGDVCVCVKVSVGEEGQCKCQ
jgi:hypothetical protein